MKKRILGTGFVATGARGDERAFVLLRGGRRASGDRGLSLFHRLFHGKQKKCSLGTLSESVFPLYPSGSSEACTQDRGSREATPTCKGI
jgi:hypothetical protein